MLRQLLLTSLLIGFVSGCVSAPPPPVETPDPVCPGTREARAKLATTLGDTPDAVLVTPWGEILVQAGAALIDLIDARCAG